MRFCVVSWFEGYHRVIDEHYLGFIVSVENVGDRQLDYNAGFQTLFLNEVGYEFSGYSEPLIVPLRPGGVTEVDLRFGVPTSDNTGGRVALILSDDYSSFGIEGGVEIRFTLQSDG